mmetsp:Transcript_7090/g.10162  ORF Transcript_7090/g.10162 Transcript_7090/m.10162 type:complete len:388 (+) Transcript_7090:55-1218(+)
MHNQIRMETDSVKRDAYKRLMMEQEHLLSQARREKCQAARRIKLQQVKLPTTSMPPQISRFRESSFIEHQHDIINKIKRQNNSNISVDKISGKDNHHIELSTCDEQSSMSSISLESMSLEDFSSSELNSRSYRSNPLLSKSMKSSCRSGKNCNDEMSDISEDAFGYDPNKVLAQLFSLKDDEKNNTESLSGPTLSTTQKQVCSNYNYRRHMDSRKSKLEDRAKLKSSVKVSPKNICNYPLIIEQLEIMKRIERQIDEERKSQKLVKSLLAQESQLQSSFAKKQQMNSSSTNKILSQTHDQVQDSKLGINTYSNKSKHSKNLSLPQTFISSKLSLNNTNSKKNHHISTMPHSSEMMTLICSGCHANLLYQENSEFVYCPFCEKISKTS